MSLKLDKVFFIIVLSIVFAFLNNHLPAQTATKDSTADSTQVELQNAVTLIFKANCSVAGCHRGTYPKKKLNLEVDKLLGSVLNVTSQEMSSLKRVDTKSPEKSYLLMKIKGEKGIKGARMPDDALPLKKKEIKVIEDWIFSLKEFNAKKEKTPPVEDVKKIRKSRR